TGVALPAEPSEPLHAPSAAGRALLLAGAATALLGVLLLPLATVQVRPDPVPVHVFDGGVVGGAAWCAACLLAVGLGLPGSRRSLSPGRWEALLGLLVLWLGIALAGHLDPHVLLGGLFSSDLAPASGGDVLVAGVLIMLAGAMLLRPSPLRRPRDG
ncbi:MAG: hypothetical protein ACREQ5_19920, partial [Candidatus Dormibacteria bacterium]